MSSSEIQIPLLNNNSSDSYDYTTIIVIIIVIIIIYLIWNTNEKFTQSNNISNKIIEKLKNHNKNLKQSIKYGNSLLDNNVNKQYEQQSYELITNQSDSNLSIDSENNYNIEDNKLQNINSENSINDTDMSYNLLNLNPENMDNFTKNNYALYAHQITCPNKCNLKANGSCNQTNYPDITLIGNNTLKNNNNKECVSCTRKPIINKINRNYDIDNDSNLFESAMNEDADRIEKKKVTFNNMDKFTNFQNEVYQNSIGETPVDKMAEIRTCGTGTCGLKSYGKSIQNVYNNLTNTISYNDRHNHEILNPMGVLEDQSNTNIYEQL